MATNWSDPNSKVSKYFTVKECTFLASWGVYHTPSEDEKNNIVKLAQKMDKVREYLARPINVHCWIRPGSVNCPGSKWHGKDFNASVGGAPKSAHKIGSGVDFSCSENCDVTRKKLESKLEEFGLCMEKLPGSGWVHLDEYPPRGGTTRYFIP